MEKIEEIKKLKSLLDHGAITNEEYQLLKSNLISNGSSIDSANITSENENQINSPVKINSSKRKGIYLLPTILGTVVILIASYLLIFNSEKNIKKRLISDGNEWIISNSDSLKEVDQRLGIVFDKNNILSRGDSKNYKIEWIDNSTYTQEFNGKTVRVKLRNYKKDVLQVAFLFEPDALPKNDNDWEKLSFEKKVKYYNEKKSTENSNPATARVLYSNNNNNATNLLSQIFGSFNNGEVKIIYSDYKNELDNGYGEFAKYFKNMVLKIDKSYLLSTDEYSYPFDLKVIFLKIFPDNERLFKISGNQLTSYGGVVFENYYGFWLLRNKKLVVASINPNIFYRSKFELQTPIISKQSGTIKFRFYESYYKNSGQIYLTDSERYYDFDPYMEKIIATRYRGTYSGKSDPEVEEW
jgi:hypothetical protein